MPLYFKNFLFKGKADLDMSWFYWKADLGTADHFIESILIKQNLLKYRDFS